MSAHAVGCQEGRPTHDVDAWTSRTAECGSSAKVTNPSKPTDARPCRVHSTTTVSMTTGPGKDLRV